MSSHTLDMSGQRQMQITMNDPAVSRVWAPAKQGDDASFSFSAREIRLPLPPNALIQKRLYERKVARKVDGAIVKENGEYVYDTETYEGFVLVLPGSCSGFVRGSKIDASDEKTYEHHTSTTVTVKKWGPELHFLESGELLEEQELGEVLRSPDVG